MTSYFQETTIFIILLPLGTKPRLESYMKFTLFNAQIHFVFSYHQSSHHFFVCNYCSLGKILNPYLLEPYPTQKHHSFSQHWHKHQDKFTRILASVEAHQEICDHGVQCDPSYRFIATAQIRFNFSLSFHPYDFDLGWVDDLRNPHALAVTGESYGEELRRRSINSVPYIRDTEQYYILYCENGWVIVESSYSHWTSPFDGFVWSMTFGFAILITLTNCKCKFFVSRRTDIYFYPFTLVKLGL